MLTFRYSVFNYLLSNLVLTQYYLRWVIMKEQYEVWLKSRKRFFRPLIMFLFIFYFALPVSLALFPNLVNNSTILGGLPFIWMYASLQIVVALVVVLIYFYKIIKFDKIVFVISIMIFNYINFILLLHIYYIIITLQYCQY